MATCKMCEKSGWLLKVDNNGLCEHCEDIYLPQLLNYCRIVIESGQIIGKTKSTATKLSRIKVAADCCDKLIPYEKRGIPTLTENPSDVIRELEKLRVETVSDEVFQLRFKAREKAKDASTDAGKLTGYNQAISKLDKLMGEVEEGLSRCPR